MDAMTQVSRPLQGHEVAAWLRRHPDLLHHYPDIALLLTVPRESGSTASLACYQVEVLRDKNRALSRRLTELAAIAQCNEDLAIRTHQLTLALMRQATLADTVRVMAASLADDFDGDRIYVILHQPVDGLEGDWLRCLPADDPALVPFHDFLRSGEPLCGRLNRAKHTMLYGQNDDAIQTTALLPLPSIGLIAIGSRDPHRFYPGMGTLFLRMMAEAFCVALARFSFPKHEN